ncbi:MAG: sensor histidine kinase, partial [Polyangiales bacterium]
RCQLEHEKEQTRDLLDRVAVMRQERLTWLESLAQFLRHELKNQLVAMGTSIDLARSGDSLEANRIYLDRAQRSLNRMRGLVSSATEATSLEAALEVDEVERVDLSALVADRVLAFQETNPSKRLDLGLNPGLFVQGNEARIAQLLDKLLNNAAEHMKPGGEIRVTLRRADGHWFELCVENEGNELPADKERIFEAFVSSRRGPENLGIGLFVARSIARNHGGTVVAEELPGAAGARFVVRLPEVGVDTDSASGDEAIQSDDLDPVSLRGAETDSFT